MATAGPKPKKYQVLGSYDDFNSQLQTTLPPPKQPDPDTVDNVDHRELPQDVWFAATISPDRGEAIIRSFREIAKARTAYQHQLEHISTARREQELVASQPGTLRKPGATITHAVQQVSELRKLNRFEQQQQEWDVQSRLLARTTQRPTTDLAMQRGEQAHIICLHYAMHGLGVPANLSTPAAPSGHFSLASFGLGRSIPM